MAGFPDKKESAPPSAPESPWLFASAVEEAKESIVITDSDLDAPGPRIIFVNAAFVRMTGYSPEDVLGKSPRVLQGPRSDREVLTRLRQTLARGETFEGEVVNYRKDGSEFYQEWQISPLRNKDGVVTNFVAFQRDITARKKAEQNLAESEERYRTLVERSPDTVFVHSDGRIVFANPATTKLLGAASAEAILGLEVMQIVHPDFHAVVRTWQQQLAAGGRTSLLEQKWVRLDGSLVDVEAMALPFVYGGKPAVQMIAHDLTEKRRLEEQFLRVQRLESLGTLAAGIAHDLNNVLAPILMAVPMLRSNALNSACASLLDDVERSAVRGADLVRHILSFAHGIGSKPQLIGLAPLVYDIVSIASKTFPKNIKIDLHVQADLWPVKAQPARLHQVLLNFCINARDAMPDGGDLRLSAENCVLDDRDSRAIEGASPGRWVVLQVEDTGTGITSEVLEHMWEPFYSTKPTDKGTGLGLATVRGIIKEYRGFVTVQTAPGRGTTFRVHLPAAWGSPTGDTIKLCAPRGEGELVLVVDDEPGVRIVAAAILLNHGYRVQATSDGAEALALFQSRREEVRLVLTDLDMPNLAGSALAIQIRQLNPDVKLVAMSSIERDPEGASLHEQFADGFLTKPFTVEHLLTLIRQLLHPE